MPDAQYSPAKLAGDVRLLLTEQGIDFAPEPDRNQAYLAAASLLLAFGVTPVIDPDDHSRAAETVRMLLAEDATKTTTRSRRSV